MRRGRPTAPVVLAEEERSELERLARRRKTNQALALRSRIVLGCAQGLTNGIGAATIAGAGYRIRRWSHHLHGPHTAAHQHQRNAHGAALLLRDHPG